MSIEAEIEGRALVAFLAGLAGALGALADHPTSSAAPPEVGDALDDVVRGFQHGERAVRQALAASDLADPYIEQAEKIISEVTASYQMLNTELSTWWSSWLSRQRDELDQQHPAEPEHMVEKEAGRGAG